VEVSFYGGGSFALRQWLIIRMLEEPIFCRRRKFQLLRWEKL